MRLVSEAAGRITAAGRQKFPDVSLIFENGNFQNSQPPNCLPPNAWKLGVVGTWAFPLRNPQNNYEGAGFESLQGGVRIRRDEGPGLHAPPILAPRPPDDPGPARAIQPPDGPLVVGACVPECVEGQERLQNPRPRWTQQRGIFLQEPQDCIKVHGR